LNQKYVDAAITLPEREEDEAKDDERSAVKESHQRRRLRSPEDFENLKFEKK
jgi:hypothetical protein